MSVKVLIADDHALVRDALADLLATTDDIDVVGQCSDGDEVLAEVGRTRPDVVLMDVELPRLDGVRAMRRVLAAHPDVSVVLLAAALSAGTARAAKASGAAGYLLKGEDPDELPERIRTVATGGSAWSRAAAALTGD